MNNLELKPTFLERLNEKYSGKFKLYTKETGYPDGYKRSLYVNDLAIFGNPAPSKFGDVIIYGDFSERMDEEDYFEEDENGYYDDADTRGLWFNVANFEGICSPTEIFESLELIFADKMVVYSRFGFPKQRRYNGFWELEQFKRFIKEGKVKKQKLYTFWSGEKPIEI